MNTEVFLACLELATPLRDMMSKVNKQFKIDQPRSFAWVQVASLASLLWTFVVLIWASHHFHRDNVAMVLLQTLLVDA